MASWLKRFGQFIRNKTNSLLGRQQVAVISQRATREVTSKVLSPLAGRLSAGQIPLQAWQTEMRQNIKNLYLNQYMIGRGGREMMTFQDWGRCGAMLKDQYKYLDNFAADLSKMDVAEREKYIAARSQLYANASNEAYERGRAAAAMALGMDQVTWNLSPAEHCDTCVGRDRVGTTPIGPRGGWMDVDEGEVWPADGKSICITNCKCYLTYSNSKTGEVWESEAAPSMGTVADLTAEQREEIIRELIADIPPEHLKGLNRIASTPEAPFPGYRYEAEALINEEGGYRVTGLYHKGLQEVYVHPAHLRQGHTLYHEVGHHVGWYQHELPEIPMMRVAERMQKAGLGFDDLGLRPYSFHSSNEFVADSYAVWLKGSKPQWRVLNDIVYEETGKSVSLEAMFGPKL